MLTGPCKLHTPFPVTDDGWDFSGLRNKPQGNVVSMVCKLSCNSNNKGSITVLVTTSLPGICSDNWSPVSLTQLFRFRNLEPGENLKLKKDSRQAMQNPEVHSAPGVLSVTCTDAGMTEDSGLARCSLGIRLSHLIMLRFTMPDDGEAGYCPLFYFGFPWKRSMR